MKHVKNVIFLIVIKFNFTQCCKKFITNERKFDIMGYFSIDFKSRGWIATIQIANMEKAGLSKEQYEDPKTVGDYFINLWNSSGKGRTSAIAVCISEKGLYHCHMALYGNTTTLNNVSRILFGSHVEPQKGGKKAVTDYLIKADKYEEKHEQVIYSQGLESIQDSQGCRSDIDEIENFINEGMKPDDIMSIKFSYRRYEKMIKDAYLAKRKRETPIIKEMNNEWHFGESGSGKTYYYVELCEKYSSDEIYLCPSFENGMLDKYVEAGAPPILFIDEFKGEIKFSELLTILDKYAYNQTHCRYTNTYNLWTTTIITSIYGPDEFFDIIIDKNRRNIDRFEQLKRRLTKIVYHYKENGAYKTYSISPENFFSSALIRKIIDQRINNEYDMNNIEYSEDDINNIDDDLE